MRAGRAARVAQAHGRVVDAHVDQGGLDILLRRVHWRRAASRGPAALVRCDRAVLLDLAADAEADAATYVQPDGIHFTRAGYRALGLRVAETLEEALIGRKAPPRTAIYPGLKKPPPAR